MKLEYCNIYCSNTHQKRLIDVHLNDPESGDLTKIRNGIGVEPTTKIYDERRFEFPDLLIVEDEIQDVARLLNSFEYHLDLFNFKTVGVFGDNGTLAKITDSFSSATPTLITLDFQMEGGEKELTNTKQAEENYGLLKTKFPAVPVIGITNFSQADFANEFIKTMRENHDNVWPKSLIYGVLPSLLEDRLSIKRLECEILEKEDQIKAVSDKKEHAFFQDYFEGDPIDPDEVRKIKINGLTPAQIMQNYDLAAGSSLAICSMFYEIDGLLKGNDSICILGEEGSGKNIMPKIIHDLSNRPKNKFVKVECDQLGDDIKEITGLLFGIEKGTYTDVTETEGKFVQALPGGTIFLDEIHHLPLDVQASLLNVIQDKSFKNRKGTFTDISGVRIVIGSNQDLHQLTLKEPKEFHSDLLSRISNILKVPNLNDRDNTCIEAIVIDTLKKVNQETGKNKSLSAKALNEFNKVNYSDPNLPAKNVREIQRRLKKAFRRCKEDIINEAWVTSKRPKDSWQIFDTEILEQHLNRLKTWIPKLEKMKKETIGQQELAVALNIKQAMISQDLGSKKNDNEGKINEIIRQQLLTQDEISTLLKLNSFKSKFSELCNLHYTLNMD